ncbi:MAG: class I SAM-dependent methyltransferase [Planctomycetes bacterium]|nr:class I SAM-dependent methyltransferase [Planctomycetota bacterium]
MNRAIVAFCLLLSTSAAVAQDEPGRRPPAPREPLLDVLDTDHDGSLSAAEIAAAGTSLARLDRDGDGALSPRELPRAAAPGRDRPAPAPATASPERPPLAADDAERRALAVLDELDASRRGNMNVPQNDGRMLRLLVEAVGAQNVVELGTSNGYSAIWMALGLRHTEGHVTTHELEPRRAQVARANLERAGVADRVTIVVGDAHETIAQLDSPIDLLFIDADKDGYLDYLQKLRERVRPGGLIVAHNMSRPRPDPAFLEAITTDPGLETLFFHLDDSGIAVTLKKRTAAER